MNLGKMVKEFPNMTKEEQEATLKEYQLFCDVIRNKFRGVVVTNEGNGMLHFWNLENFAYGQPNRFGQTLDVKDEAGLRYQIMAFVEETHPETNWVAVTNPNERYGDGWFNMGFK